MSNADTQTGFGQTRLGQTASWEGNKGAAGSGRLARVSGSGMVLSDIDYVGELGDSSRYRHLISPQRVRLLLGYGEVLGRELQKALRLGKTFRA